MMKNVSALTSASFPRVLIALLKTNIERGCFVLVGNFIIIILPTSKTV